jgi:tetratricopeptide (TPR) repeat protein
MTNLCRAEEILSLCGLCGSNLDHHIRVSQAEIHLIKSEYAQAKTIYNQIIESISPDQNAYVYALALVNIAKIEIIIGQPTGTVVVCQYLSKAREVFKDMNLLADVTFCDMLWTDIELRDGKPDLAKVKFSHHINAARGKENEIMTFCLERLADVNAWQSVELQSIWPVTYLAYAHKSKQKLPLLKALLFLGDVFISHEDEDIAQNLWIVALEGFTYMDVHHSRAQCMLRLGDLADKRGEISTAIELWKSARPLFEISSQTKDMAQIDLRLMAVEEAPREALDKLENFHPPVKLFQRLNFQCNQVWC